MELSSCPDCQDLAKALREHVEMVREAREYATDPHEAELRKVSPLVALQEQAMYYEGMMDEQEEAINDLETDINNLEFLLEGTQINFRQEKKQSELQIKYVTKLTAQIDKLAKYLLSISPHGIPEGGACEVAIKLIEFLRKDDGETKEFKICVPRLL